MPDQQPTIGELYKAKTITDEAINGAVDTILAGKTDAAYPITDGLVLDLGAAVQGSVGQRARMVARNAGRAQAAPWRAINRSR